MCGIVGIYNKKGSINSQSVTTFLEKSLLEMKRRGPDAQKSILIDSYYATGFTRLAIRDLSENGMQPMQTNCGNYSISFNGEIYNTQLLIDNLNEYSIPYKSSSDTELILYHFKHFGFLTTINLLDGIFAIALYNHKKNELFLARDRSGVKPLYVYHDNDYLIYSSHYNQVVSNIFIKNREISLEGFSAYIKLGYVPSGYGFFKKSFLLPQGSYLSVKKGEFLKPKLYYQYNKTTTNQVNLSKKIKDTVKNQLVSDVPVGTFLSGGIDSSIISMYANEIQRIQAFNIGFSNRDYDESIIAESFAKQKNIDFNKKIFDEINYVQLIEDNIEAYSEPFSDYSSLPTLLLSGFAKEHVTVALSGDGGDELFYGYPRNIKYGLQAELLTSTYLKKVFKIGVSKILSKPLKLPVYEILSKTNKVLIESNYVTAVKNLGNHILPNIKNDIYLDFLNNKEECLSNKKDFLVALRRNEFYYHLQRILLKVDRASMFHSLETRVPLLSNEIIDASLSYSFKECTSATKGKLPLRKILKDEVEGNLFDLQKKGFTLALDELINNDESGIFDKYILADIPELDQLLNTSFIKEMYQNHKDMIGKYKDTSWLLWSIFSLKAWYINHIDK